MTQNRLDALSKSMDEAVEKLTTFDAEGLESLEKRLRAVTAEYRAHGMADSREKLPELLQKHSILQAVLRATAANLKVMESVLDGRRTKAQDGRKNINGYLDRITESVEERSAVGPNSAERHGQ